MRPPKEPRPPKTIKTPKPPKEVKVKTPQPPKKVKTPKEPKVRESSSGGRLSALAVVIGSIGLLLSIILAFGALFVALGADQNAAFFSHWANLCDALVGPLKNLFDFSGVNAQKKESLAAWGLGSIAYLLIGRLVQAALQGSVEKKKKGIPM